MEEILRLLSRSLRHILVDIFYRARRLFADGYHAVIVRSAAFSAAEVTSAHLSCLRPTDGLTVLNPTLVHTHSQKHNYDLVAPVIEKDGNF